MKTFCKTTMIGIFLLICADGIQAQPTQTRLKQVVLMKLVSEKTWINTYQRLQDFENIHDFSGKVENHEMRYSKKLKTSKGYQLKSAMAGTQKIDSAIYEVWDTVSSQWVGDSKYVCTYATMHTGTYLKTGKYPSVIWLRDYICIG
jgi:hypothetical protein